MTAVRWVSNIPPDAVTLYMTYSMSFKRITERNALDWKTAGTHHVHWGRRPEQPNGDVSTCTAVISVDADNGNCLVQRYDGVTKVFTGSNAEQQAKQWVETLAKLDGFI